MIIINIIGSVINVLVYLVHCCTVGGTLDNEGTFSWISERYTMINQ